MARHHRRRGTDWSEFTADTFRDSMGISLGLIMFQAVVSALFGRWGLLVAVGVWIYTIATFISEGNNVYSATSGTALVKAIIILVIDILVLILFWNVNV